MAVELRPNSTIKVLLSDGDPELGPPLLDPPPKGATECNYYVVGDDKINKHWRKVLGRYLADLLELDKSKDWHLEDFPFGYTLYTRQKGIISTPRRDHYLFGAHGLSQPFRSPQEFQLHLRWLIRASPRDENGQTMCECRYCKPEGRVRHDGEHTTHEPRQLRPPEAPLFTRPPKDYRSLAM